MSNVNNNACGTFTKKCVGDQLMNVHRGRGTETLELLLKELTEPKAEGRHTTERLIKGANRCPIITCAVHIHCAVFIAVTVCVSKKKNNKTFLQDNTVLKFLHWV